MVLESTFSEPRLIMFRSDDGTTEEISQGFVVSEKNIVFEITNYSVIDGLISLLASYYVFHVNYPTSVPAQSLLLFLQEVLLEHSAEPGTKKTAKYRATINSLKKCIKNTAEET